MKKNVIAAEWNTPRIGKKYIPTPQAADIILAYFVFNNFQDFNTWQQIAKTKTQYEYIETKKNSCTCKVTLKSLDKDMHTLIENSQGKNKKDAKKKTLKKLVQSLMFNGYIGYGFKDIDFVSKLPHRRKDSTESNEDEQNQVHILQLRKMKLLLSQERIQQAFECISIQNIIICWNYALINSDINLCSRCLEKVAKFEVQKEMFEDIPEESVHSIIGQGYYKKQLKDPFEEDLADFMNYYQIQSPIKYHAYIPHQIRINANLLPSEEIFMSDTKTELEPEKVSFKHFYPIQGTKQLIKIQKKEEKNFFTLNEQLMLPRFLDSTVQIPIKTIEMLYNRILFSATCYKFALQSLQLLNKYCQHIKVTNNFVILSQQHQNYYLKHKHILVGQFLYLLFKKISTPTINIQGLIIQYKNNNIFHHIVLFTSRQPQNILNKKINKKYNYSEFIEMNQIAQGEFVILKSKINPILQYIGEIKQISISGIKIQVPLLNQYLNQPMPFTLYKLYNNKIYNRLSNSLLSVIKNNYDIIKQARLIFQPPTYPHLSVISELLVEWITLKKTILIISPNIHRLQAYLNYLGFNCYKISAKMEERTIVRSNIICCQPINCCCDMLRNYAFSRVLIDEANKVPQILSLLSISMGCQKLYLIGDIHMPRNQVLSTYAMCFEMNVSLFERLYRQGTSTITFTSKKQQYLGDGLALEWINNIFYTEQLRFNSQCKMTMIKGFPWPSNKIRLCLLHAAMDENVSKYQNKICYICSCITAQVIKSGFTKLEQIIWNAENTNLFYLLKMNFYDLLNVMNLQYTQMQKYVKSVNDLVRIPDGSKHYQSALAIYVIDDDGTLQIKQSYRKLIAVITQGMQGVIIVGNVQQMMARSPQWISFINWANNNKIIIKFQSTQTNDIDTNFTL